MRKRDHELLVAIAVLALACSTTTTQAAETFVKLNAALIRAVFVGMDFTDDVHWAEQYFRDGTVKSVHMGSADTGRWRIEKDAFCVDYVKSQRAYHEVWRSGVNFQLRREDGSVFLEGSLVKHQQRG